MLLRFLARHFFLIDLGFFLLFHFGIRNFVLSAEISHAKRCVCKINKSNFKIIAEYFVVPINDNREFLAGKSMKRNDVINKESFQRFRR